MLQDVLANEISIHAPRAGRDRRVSRASKAPRISIHAPRAGRDRRLRLYRADPEISIHAPRAGRDMRDDSAYSIRRHISIHAPRAGRDVIILRIRIEQSAFQSTRPVRGATISEDTAAHGVEFQSTRPVRGATPPRYYDKLYDVISIHAPRAGRDLVRYYGPDYDNLFQSTRPVRGATS